MRITALDVMVADGGISSFHFLKLSTDAGIIGWSEFGDGLPSPGGLAALILHLGQRTIGSDPREVRRLTVDLYAATRFASGGMYAQAIAAIENACLDVAARSLGVSVSDLFGGRLRSRIPLYWSHCGMQRVRRPQVLAGAPPPLASLADVTALGAEVAARGFRALKTNLIRFDGGEPRLQRGGFAPVGAGPELNATPAAVAAATALIAAFREGAGPEVEIALDLNSNFRADGFVRMARALEPFDLAWLELDLPDAASLAAVRRATKTPIGSLETIYHRRALMPFLEARAVDLAIVDVMWNGFSESLAMASAAEGYDVSCAPHVYAGPLSALMGAHFAALLPNLRIMELEVDVSAWHDSFVSCPLRVENGALLLPPGPGWGGEIDERVLRDHPAGG